LFINIGGKHMPDLGAVRKVVSREYLEEMIIKGLILYGADKGSDFVRQSFYTIDKNLKQWSEPATKIGLGLGAEVISDVLPEKMKEAGPIISGRALQNTLEIVIDKKPYIVALDSSTIEFYNFDPSATITYSIDGGTNATISTDANGYAKLTLTTALASGKHDISAMSKTKALHTIIVV
jgi:hypothetical protein